MIYNYLKIALRNLIRNKVYSFIKIFSLMVGLTAAIFTFLWVMDEMSFDKFHANTTNIYKVMTNNIYPDGRIETYPATTALLRDAIRTEIPEVDKVALLSMETNALIRHEKNSFNEQGVYADSSLFSIFSFPLLKGDKKNPIPDNAAMIISEKLATKLFGDKEPLGESITVDNVNSFMITGVFANIPSNSSLQFDFVLPIGLFVKENPWTQNWRSGGTQTMVALKPSASLENANAKIGGLIKKNCRDCSTNAFLFPYTQQRLYGEFENGKSVGGRIEQVKLFSIIAAIVLLMACINFMNLATAQSAARSREIGVRKLIGARQSGLIIHFLSESLLLSFISLLFALIAVHVLLPFFNEITEKSVQLDFTNPIFILGLLLITLVCGLLAGCYPAFLLSSFQPADVLKGNLSLSLSGRFRKILVVVQFVTSIILITGSITIYKQINFISNKNLGFQKENIIEIKQNDMLDKNYAPFKNDLLQIPSVKSIGFGGSNIFTIPITTTDPVWRNKPVNSSMTFKVFRCDAGFIPTMNIGLLAGRNFSDINNIDSANYIINRKAMEVMGLTPDNVIGADLQMWNGKGKIVGLTNDFNNDNLRRGIEPLIFLYSKNIGSNYFIKIDGSTPVKTTLAAIEKTFRKHSPSYLFEYSFLDEIFAREYRTELIIGKLSLIVTVFAVLICCLGLFGLVAYTAVKRTKEIGVRKVLGASVSSILALLSKDFIGLVILAFIIAAPVAYFIMQKWLRSFAYHTNISWWVFAAAGAGALVFTLLTMSFQAIRAALANPVKSLKNE
ncbi:ABC transporter permease [Emticicia sp. BO119]|uniref:ABC transporter permease n=1 Tax=Emticicia sp. BO119 TaxID=2757768 RepID=UPI0015F08538|nr:ABC transporter permease [Emticicia sp. BO119]MBA4850742.1 ABC transporter permease [Emticicia sp. BO119]